MHILEFLRLKVQYPLIVYCDNQGAICLGNRSEGKRTKHIAIRYHYVREFVENDTIKLVFVKSENNLADNYTKNNSLDIQQKLTRGYMGVFT